MSGPKVPPPPPGAVRVSKVPPPPPGAVRVQAPEQTMLDRWRAAEKSPDLRTELAREIGRSFAEKQYSGVRGKAAAFGKTGQDIAGFGLGRRGLRKQAQRTFPGMTNEEASIVADEADRLQFEMQPLSTLGGGLTGVVGGGGLIGGALGAGARAPGLLGRAARLTQMRQGPGTMAGNIARGAAGGALGTAATAGYGDERLPTPVELGVGTAMGGAIPGAAQAAGNWLSRTLRPVREAQRRIGRDIGPEGAQAAEEFAAATGEQIPVGAAVLTPSSAPAVARSMPIPDDSATRIQNAIDTVSRSLVSGMRRTVGSRIPGGDTPLKPKQLKSAATEFSNEFLGPVKDLPINLKTPEMFDLSDIFEKLADEPQIPDRNLMKVKAEQFRLGNVTVKQAEDARMLLKDWSNKTVGGRETYKKYIDTLVDALDREVPGYRDDYLGRHAELLDAADKAKAGMKITTKDLPQGFAAEVTKRGQIDPAAQMGMGYAILKEVGETPESAFAFAQKYGRPSMSPAQRLEAGLGQPGREISQAAEQYARSVEGVRRLVPSAPGMARGPTGTEFGLAVAQPGLYFPLRVASRLISGISLPTNVRREVMELMTDPARVDEAIAAMRAGGVRDDAINQFVRNYRTALSTLVGQQSVGEQGEPDLMSQMIDPVSRAMFELRGDGRSNTDAELNAAEERLQEMLDQGMSPEQAINAYLREIRGQR